MRPWRQARSALNQESTSLQVDLLSLSGRNDHDRNASAWRWLATRYDKTPESYFAGLHLRGAVIWLRSLQSTA
ncbi:hypothetical protein [Streptomyces sp. NPDC057494]|uniref:hypothetical protein n=1 Tax=Streptomyces sp. NPDC057494 TaxID=3346148 RepID=UPI0036772614